MAIMWITTRRVRKVRVGRWESIRRDVEKREAGWGRGDKKQGDGCVWGVVWGKEYVNVVLYLYLFIIIYSVMDWNKFIIIKQANYIKEIKSYYRQLNKENKISFVSISL